jgi:predicted RND superfamily exporter protein
MGFVLVARTIRRTSGTLMDHKLGALVPVFGVLVLLALLLWVINSIAPLAPFVYSLF